MFMLKCLLLIAFTFCSLTMVYLLSPGVSALSDNNWHPASPRSPQSRSTFHWSWQSWDGGGPGGRPGPRTRGGPLPDHPDLVPHPGRRAPPLEDGGRLQPLPRQPRHPRHRPPTRHTERGNTWHGETMVSIVTSFLGKSYKRRCCRGAETANWRDVHLADDDGRHLRRVLSPRRHLGHRGLRDAHR